MRRDPLFATQMHETQEKKRGRGKERRPRTGTVRSAFRTEKQPTTTGEKEKDERERY